MRRIILFILVLMFIPSVRAVTETTYSTGAGTWAIAGNDCIPTSLDNMIDNNYSSVTSGTVGCTLTAFYGASTQTAIDLSYVQVNLSELRLIHSVTLKAGLYHTTGNNAYLTLEGSTDGTSWTNITIINTTLGAEQVSNTNYPVEANYRYIRSSLYRQLAGGVAVARWYEIDIFSDPLPTLLTPTNGSTESKTYPPLTEDINFTWSSGETLDSNLVIARDINFNLITVNTIVSTNYSSQSLEADNYWWKVRFYNSTSGTYGNYSDTFNFTLSETSSASGIGFDGIVYELINGVQTPISGATVYLYNNTYSASTTTGSNGYYLFSGLANATTYSIYASKQGYDTTTAFPVTTENGTISTNNILMKIYISPYVPNWVYEKFTISGLFDNPYPGVTVTVYKGDELTALFTGTTDTAGQIVFQLIKDQKYRLVLSGGGLSDTLTYTIYGKEENYLITIVSGFPTGGDRHEDINASFLVSTFNATYSNLSLFYNDTRSSTTALNFWVIDKDTNTTVCSSSSTDQTITLNCTVLTSGSYQLSFNATSSVYGFFQQDKIINFDYGNTTSPDIPLSGVSSTILNWIAIMIIGLVAALFSIRTVKYGAVIIPSIAMVFWAFGWLNAPFLLVSIALIIGVLVYVRMSEVKVNY